MQRFPATWNLVRHRRVNFTFDFTGRLFLVEFMSTEEHPRPHLSYDLSDFDSPNGFSNVIKFKFDYIA